MTTVQRVRVLGAPVDVVDMRAAIQFVDSKVAEGGDSGYVVAINPEKTFAIRKNKDLGTFVENASLLIPDGIGVVLAAKFLHGAQIGRVPGADLMQEICRHSAEKRHRLFLYGASEDVSRDAVVELRRRFPGIMIVGRANGYVPQEDMEDLVDRINDSRADILFVALGSPRQEAWMQKYGPGLKTKLCLGIGGTLDTIVGKVRRAPKFMQWLGLEWFFRLLCQPSRIRRQGVLPKFAAEVLTEKFKRPRRPR
jgi:N-acetylglucosaminyldiphosphoundecaprenol N-acetyl-beta-D-mannosaminyltransferase